MRPVGTRIREQRARLGLTLQQLADRVGCTRSYLSQVETGSRANPPSDALLERLERALRLPANELVHMAEWERVPEHVKQRVRELIAHSRRASLLARLVLDDSAMDGAHRSGLIDRLARDLCSHDPEQSFDEASAAIRAALAVMQDSEPIGMPSQVPVINTVAMGYPTAFTDLGYPARIASEYLSVPDMFDSDAFAVRVVGREMLPEYREGDIVVCSPRAPTPAGKDCFVRFEGEAETTFKRVYFEDGGSGMIRLQPLNSSYPPRVVSREAVAGLYAAVFVVRAVA